VSKGLGRLQTRVLLDLYETRDSGGWVRASGLQRRPRLDGAAGTARHRSDQAAVRRGIRTLTERGLAECQIESSAPPRRLLLARITVDGIRYIRERALHPDD
jgi:hypothetical protein